MNDEMVLIPGVLVVVGQLCVLCCLVLKGPVQTTVVLLQHHHPVFQNSRALNVTDHNRLRSAGQGLDQLIGAVEQMEDEFKPGVWSQMNSVNLERWSWKAWEQMDVEDIGRLVGHHAGELLDHLGDAIAVPDGKGSVHRRSHEKQSFGMFFGILSKHEAELPQNWLDPVGDGGH